jgi:putative nicotinate phosphoribosyltransferase
MDGENCADPLLTDLYQLAMAEAYLKAGMTGTAVFEFFVRKLPVRRGFLLAGGLEQAVAYLTSLQFDEDALGWLSRSGRFAQPLIDYLAAFRFSGDVDAMPEGSVFFAEEPILRVTAPLPEAQLVETRLINILNFQTLIAAKAARMVLAAPGKQLVDFGAARARRRSGCACGTCRLHCWLRRHRDRLRRRGVRNSHFRYHGAFLHSGSRRRDGRIREFRPRPA